MLSKILPGILPLLTKFPYYIPPISVWPRHTPTPTPPSFHIPFLWMKASGYVASLVAYSETYRVLRNCDFSGTSKNPRVGPSV